MPEATGRYSAGAWLYVYVGAPVALVCMLALFGAGLSLALYAVWVGATVSFQAGIAWLLKGIELLLLAPVVYLVLATMTTLVVSVRQRLRVLNWQSSEPGGAASRRHLEETLQVVHSVKQSVAALFVALLLTDFIARILNREPFTWLEISAQTSALLIGVLYFAVQMHSSSTPHEQHEPADSGPGETRP